MTVQRKNVVSSPVIGTLIFILTELMFFSALISAYLIVSATMPVWPPLDQPRLPVTTTAFNTLVLFISGVLLLAGYRFFRRQKKPEDVSGARKLLWGAFVTGAFFVLVQGMEWIRLIHYGLTVSSSVYGSFFYLIIGAHAVHAVVALWFLGMLVIRMKKRSLQPETFRAVSLFWYFVVGIWPVLYGLVYF